MSLYRYMWIKETHVLEMLNVFTYWPAMSISTNFTKYLDTECQDWLDLSTDPYVRKLSLFKE